MRGRYNAMPRRSTSIGSRLDQQHPAMTIGAVRATRVISGRVYVDVDDLTAGSYYQACPLMVFGGSPDAFVFVPAIETPNVDGGLAGQPPTGGSTQATFDHEVILLHRGHGRPYAIGMAPHPDMKISEETPEDPGDADHVRSVGKDDIAIKSNGALWLMDRNGSVTVDTTQSGQRVRVQLAEEGGRLRVSRGGQASERVLLADAMVSYAESIEAQIDEMRNRISLLETSVNAIVAALAAGLELNIPAGTTAPAVIPAPGASVLNPPYDAIDERVVSSSVEISNLNARDDQ